MAAGMTVTRVNLALQGGGAHGAFTWGALDRLLDEEDIEVEAITATSAGAMNASAFKAGWVSGGRQGAKDALRDFWLSIAGVDGHVADVMGEWFRTIVPSPAALSRMLEFSPTALMADGLARTVSPYQFNPTGFHPLRAIVDEQIAEEHVCAATGPALFIAATNVRTGRVRVFSGDEVTTDAILASACLPTLFQAVEMDDPLTGRREAYWDGGYMGNPALFPLFYDTTCRDVLIVHINPIERTDLPYTATEILNRINEISFNGSLLRELRGIDFVNRMIAEGVLPEGRMTENRIHSIRDDAFMSQLGIASKMTPSVALMVQLHDAGQAAMDGFLSAHKADIGVRSTVDLRAMFQGTGL
jgi:NTE family protein